MKTLITEKSKIFQNVTIEITMETEEELTAIYQLFNHAVSIAAKEKLDINIMQNIVDRIWPALSALRNKYENPET